MHISLRDRLELRADIGVTIVDFSIVNTFLRVDHKVQQSIDSMGGLFFCTTSRSPLVLNLTRVDMTFTGNLDGTGSWDAVRILGRTQYQRGEKTRTAVNLVGELSPFVLVLDWNMAQVTFNSDLRFCGGKVGR